MADKYPNDPPPAYSVLNTSDAVIDESNTDNQQPNPSISTSFQNSNSSQSNNSYQNPNSSQSTKSDTYQQHSSTASTSRQDNISSSSGSSIASNMASTISQRLNLQQIPQNFHFNKNDGLIGNALHLVGGVVGTAAQIGFGTAGLAIEGAAAVTHTAAQSPHLAYNYIKKKGKEKQRSASPSLSSEDDQDSKVIKQSNSNLTFDGDWTGKKCKLETSNGNLFVNGSIACQDAISLKTSNGNIVVEGELSAGNEVKVKGSNGTFSIGGTSIITKDLDVNISNGQIKFQDKQYIEADTVKISTCNAPVLIDHITIGSRLSVKTTNAIVEIHVERMNENCKIEIESSNAPVNLYLPKTFKGCEFSLKSNTFGQVNIHHSDKFKFVYKTDTLTTKKGQCTSMYEQDSNNLVEMSMKTSNAPVNLYA